MRNGKLSIRAGLAGLVLLAALAILALSRGRLAVPRPVTDGAGRQAKVLYLSPSHAPDLWSISSSGENATRLTDTGGKVSDYGVSFDGEHIAYALRNEQQGVDLWEMDRQGGSARRLLPCGADWCENPSYAPDGSRIAYSRRRVSGLPGRQPEMPRLWMLDRAELNTAEVFANPHIGGGRAAWSPDGRFLAFYDAGSGGVRVYNTETKKDFVTPAADGSGVEWSPDSSALLYLQGGIRNEMPYSAVYRLNPRTQESAEILGEDAPGEYSVPAWSADGVWAAVGQRLEGGSLTRQLWLIELGDGAGQQKTGRARKAITDDVMFNHGGYRWEPGGARLVFQRLEYGRSDSLPQVMIWNREDGKTALLAEDAFQPQWLP